MRAADLLFHTVHSKAELESSEDPQFWTNPANTLTYAAMKALEDTSIVHLAEVLRNKAMAVPPEVRHVEALGLHRNAASHPYILKWRTKDMQDFHEQKRKYLDVRAALVWDMKRSVDELIVKAGRIPKHSLNVNQQMVHSLRASLQGCMRSEAIGWTNDDAGLLAALEGFWVRFNDFLIQRAPTPGTP